LGSYNFGFDLAEGEIAEDLVRELLSGKRGSIEIKRDTIVSESGNIAVEWECRGKPSGIRVTTAMWWAFVLTGEKYQDEIVIMVLTERLKAMCDWHIKKGKSVDGGDDKESKMVLLDLGRLLLWNPYVGRMPKTDPKTTSPVTDRKTAPEKLVENPRGIHNGMPDPEQRPSAASQGPAR